MEDMKTIGAPEMNIIGAPIRSSKNTVITPDVKYESYAAESGDTSIDDILPAEGAKDTIYRVASWDGTQVDATKSSEYVWDGEDYILLRVLEDTIGDGVFDISAYNASGGTLATYADLAAALGSSGANVPEGVRKGGMSVKYVQSSDNKYVQYMYKETDAATAATFTNVANWEKLNLEGVVNELGKEVDGMSQSFIDVLGNLKQNAELNDSHSTTTITGWGLGLVTNKTLYKVKVKAGNRNYSSTPITHLKLTLRKETRDGEILAKKTIPFSASDNLLHDVEFDFLETPVNYSGVIYCTLQADNAIKVGLISSTDYAYSSLKTSYATSTDLQEDVTFTNSSGSTLRPLWVGYIDSYDKKLDVKEENIEDGAVTTNKVADGAITKDKLAADVNPDAGVAVCLPKDIYVVSGSRLQLFYRGIVSAFDPYSYNIEVSVYNSTTGLTAGAAYPRYYQLDATPENVGNYALTINVRNNNNDIIASGTSTIHVIAVPTSPVSQKNILTFGASVVSYGFIVKELERRLTTNTGQAKPSDPTGINLTNIAFIGRKTGSIETSVHQEATGGLGWYNYATAGANRYRFYIAEGGDTIVLNESFVYSGITFTVKEKNITGGEGNISCSFTGSGTVPESGTLPLVSGNVDYTSWVLENTSPFFNANTNQIDFANYSSLYCNGDTIDILLSHLGVNSMSGSTWDLDTIIDNIKTIARAYHSYNSSGKFVISTIAVPDPTGGFGYNYHADGAVSNYYTIVRRFFLFAQAIENIAQDEEFSGYVVHCPVMPECDGEWMYPKYEMQVNNRNTTKEQVGANAYHPSTSNPIGYYMIADAIYQTICSIL